jgi:hypothetical protein
MHKLAEIAARAHGGLARWGGLRTVSADFIQGRALWPLKGRIGLLEIVSVRAALAR